MMHITYLIASLEGGGAEKQALYQLIESKKRDINTSLIAFSLSEHSKHKLNEFNINYYIVGKSIPMQGVYRLVARLMNTDLPILVSGESGTGKSLISKVIHRFSDRRNLPLVPVSPADLVEIDGPSKILAKARGGSIIIEEISDFSLESQARLVQMIDSPGEYSPRFIATMQGSMAGAVENGIIRKDVFYRLSGATIELPTLRECVDCLLYTSPSPRDRG
mgnify:CR=1 FL=1